MVKSICLYMWSMSAYCTSCEETNACFLNVKYRSINSRGILIYLQCIFTMCMKRRTCIVDIVLIVPNRCINGTQSQCMKSFHFSLKLCLFRYKMVDSASNVLSTLKFKKWMFLFCLFTLQLTCGMFAFLVRFTASCIFSILL